jgi:uncharacterized membrane protein YdjX (TVP38/TMEM64 family)
MAGRNKNGSDSRNTGTRAVRVIVLMVALASFAVMGRYWGDSLPSLLEWVRGQGATGAIVFVAVYALATVAMVPGSLMTLAAGAVYGVANGTALVMAGATLGANLAFLVSRYLARPAVESRLRKRPGLASMEAAVAQRGLHVVFLLRLSPLFPFNLLNYALGLTSIRARDYLLACAGMLPGTLLYVYYGAAGGEAVQLAGGNSSHGPGWYATMLVGLLATVAVTAMVTRYARAGLADLDEDSTS